MTGGVGTGSYSSLQWALDFVFEGGGVASSISWNDELILAPAHPDLLGADLAARPLGGPGWAPRREQGDVPRGANAHQWQNVREKKV